eukprot:3789792-Pyramimonas_sp.AAC.1
MGQYLPWLTGHVLGKVSRRWGKGIMTQKGAVPSQYSSSSFSSFSSSSYHPLPLTPDGRATSIVRVPIRRVG